MYANAVTVKIDQEHAARKALHKEVIPRISEQPGFLIGYWLAPTDGDGHSLTLWEDERTARDAAGMVQVGTSPGPGVTVTHVVTAEVIGHAPSGGAAKVLEATARIARAVEHLTVTAARAGEEDAVARGAKVLEASVAPVEKATARSKKRVSKVTRSAASKSRTTSKSSAKATKTAKKGPPRKG